ncbi:hypothetical protein GGI25_000833 [Coemansia spiralis]|uniref:Uncharacterized protein n=1 Tax=Coemansia spiralis TaxID=417178 RepID=A0A9W8GDX0_9FUNG|nr:hypothetical protein GGI25_000833 [Coemansia spiralis]
MFAPTTGTVDYFCCDIYVQRSTDNDAARKSTRWHSVDSLDELRMWEAKLFTFFSNKIGRYIWNREPFVVFANMRGKVPRLSGQMVHGDAIDDEWLAVWLLREASRQFPELVISVRDADGEFLLAEAAMYIPHWLTPENSQNRAWLLWLTENIGKGRLHIVPLHMIEISTGVESEFIGLDTALTAVIGGSDITLASTATEKAAFERLAAYPEKLKESMHSARCILPEAIAKTIAQHPQLVSAATELFYGHDTAQIKACGRIKAFPQEPSVSTTVTFNRVQYAKLASHGLPPLVGYKLPPAQSPEFKASSLGMKLACGFEILNNEQPGPLSERRRHAQVEKDEGVDKALFEFMQKLTQTGYFDGLVVTSASFDKRHKQAAQYFAECKREQASISVDNFTRQAALSFADAFLQTEQSDFEGIVCDDTASDEDDSWLSLHPDELDALMCKADAVLRETSQEDHGPQLASVGGRDGNDDGSAIEGMYAGDKDAAQSLQGILNKFEAFLVADSGIEGAELNSDDSDGSEFLESSDEDIDLDADGIIQALMKAVDANDRDEMAKQGGSRDNSITGNNARSAINRDFGNGNDQPVHSNVIADDVDNGTVFGNTRQQYMQLDGKHAFQDGQGSVDMSLVALMDAMDKELSASNVGQSFVRVPWADKSSNNKGKGKGKEIDFDDDIPDVDVDLNLVENIVESFRAQEGLPGPAGTILQQFGIHLPRIDDDNNDNNDDDDYTRGSTDSRHMDEMMQ